MRQTGANDLLQGFLDVLLLSAIHARHARRAVCRGLPVSLLMRLLPLPFSSAARVVSCDSIENRPGSIGLEKRYQCRFYTGRSLSFRPEGLKALICSFICRERLSEGVCRRFSLLLVLARPAKRVRVL